MLIYVMVGLFGVLLLVSYLLTYGRILKSIARLQAGAAVIGSGKLDFKIEEKKNDEIGDLSHAFNRMTSSLKEVTASKADLEREMAQRKKAEDASREAHERAIWLARFPEQNPNPIIRASADGAVLYCNPASVKIHGWKCEVSQLLQNELLPLLGRGMAEGKEVQQDVELGGRFYFAWVAPFPEEGYANIYGRDITDRRQAEEALRNSEARYRSYIEMTEQLGWTTNAEGEVVEDIPSWRKFTGQSEEEVKGWGWSKALHPDDVDHTARVWRNAVAKRNNYEVEYRIRRYDGVYRDFLARGVPVFNDDGNVREWIGTCIDITERKKAEVTLRESEQRLNRAQEIAHLGSWELDLVNNRLTWSDEVYRIFGLQPQEFGATYEAFLAAVHPDDRGAIDAAYSSSLREGKDTYEIEHRVVRKSTGETRIVHERCEHIRDESGRIIRSVGMVHDITERKRAEEAVRQRTMELQHLTETLEQQVRERTEELEVANEELRVEIDECMRADIALKESESNLRHLSLELLSAQEKERKAVAGEIHDSIGSSLAAIKFKVDNALTEVADKSPETTSILKSLSPIIQGAIDEARRIQMNLRPSMLDDLGLLATIRWLCRQFESTYSGIRLSQGIKIEEHEVPDHLKTVLFRVLQEGLNNVAKHSKAKIVLLLLRKTPRGVQLVIRDNGQGLDVSKAQSPDDTTHGFGLRGMRERTELSGGTFKIESTPGKGTTVRASWPI
jgi:PAS domain S-box-containing protein